MVNKFSPREIKFLFYSILFYSILFYSILFYSILFYSMGSQGLSRVPRASRPHASSLGPGTHRTGTARKLALISNAHGN